MNRKLQAMCGSNNHMSLRFFYKFQNEISPPVFCFPHSPFTYWCRPWFIPEHSQGYNNLMLGAIHLLESWIVPPTPHLLLRISSSFPHIIHKGSEDNFCFLPHVYHGINEPYIA